jgi:hypothetical protein
MLGHARGEKVGPVDIDAPELLHAVKGVIDRFEVLCESGGCDEVVDLIVLREDFGEGCVYRVRVGYIGVMGSDIW